MLRSPAWGRTPLALAIKSEQWVYGGRDPSPAPGRQRRPAGDHPARPRLTLVIEQPPDPGEENSHPRAAEALQPPGLRLRGRRTRRGLRYCSRALRAPASRDPRGGRSPGRPATREAPPLPPRRSPGSRTSPPRCLLEPRGPPSSPSSSPVAAGAGAGRGGGSAQARGWRRGSGIGGLCSGEGGRRWLGLECGRPGLRFLLGLEPQCNYVAMPTSRPTHTSKSPRLGPRRR